MSSSYFAVTIVMTPTINGGKDLLLSTLSCVTFLTNIHMMFLGIVEVYMMRMTLWLFTVPILFYIIGEHMQTNMFASTICFEVSVILKILMDCFQQLDTNYLHIACLVLGMASTTKVCMVKNHFQTKYIILAVWSAYAALHIIFVFNDTNLAYINCCHAILDVFMKMFLTSYIIQYNDTIYTVFNAQKSLDDVRSLMQIYKIVQHATSDKSRVLSHIKSIIKNSVENIENNVELKNSIINTVFFGNSLQELLKTGSFVKEYECIGILFVDIVNYTVMCKNMSPKALTKYMNAVYTIYDELLREFPVLLKIETIGDAYMVISGAQNLKNMQTSIEPCKHLHTLIAFAVRLVASLPSINLNLEYPLSIRAGISCGPISISIVGIDVPRCCVFGHTVNMASRVQNMAKDNGIVITDTVFKRTEMDPSWIIDGPKEVDLKGIGITSVYSIDMMHGRME
jgi:guanylate cyclase